MDQRSARPGLARFSAYGVLSVTRFRDVPILPSTKIVDGVPNGGPLLPWWERQVQLRDGVGGVTKATPARKVPDKIDTLDETVLWGGVIEPGLAEQVAVSASRLLVSTKQRSNDRIVFVTHPGQSVADVPHSFWDILDWYGITREKVFIVERPVKVTELWIAPQLEQLGGLGPSYDALELQAENTDARGLHPTENKVVFLTSTGGQPNGLGAWLGEDYLAQRLTSLGVHVADTSGMDLQERLSLYAGAQTLICSSREDAAARMLLGYYDQDIVILNQTPDARYAMANLAPRCQQVVYAEVTQDRLTLPFQDGEPYLEGAISTFSLDTLFRLFHFYDVDLRAVWDTKAYSRSVKQGLQVWVREHRTLQASGKVQFNWDGMVDALEPLVQQTGIRLTDDPQLKDLLSAKTNTP